MTKKVSIDFDENVLAYLDSERSRIGVSRASMLSYMIDQYKLQREAVRAMNQMPQVLSKLEELEGKIDESKA